MLKHILQMPACKIPRLPSLCRIWKSNIIRLYLYATFIDVPNIPNCSKLQLVSNYITIGHCPYWQQSSRKSTQVIYPIKRENNCTIASRVKNYSLKITIVMYLICQSNLYFYVSLIKSSLKNMGESTISSHWLSS